MPYSHSNSKYKTIFPNQLRKFFVVLFLRGAKKQHNKKLILTIFRIAAPHNDILPCEPYRGKVFYCEHSEAILCHMRTITTFKGGAQTCCCT